MLVLDVCKSIMSKHTKMDHQVEHLKQGAVKRASVIALGAYWPTPPPHYQPLLLSP